MNLFRSDGCANKSLVKFEYLGNREGHSVEGKIEAESPNDAIRLLSQRGIKVAGLKAASAEQARVIALPSKLQQPQQPQPPQQPLPTHRATAVNADGERVVIPTTATSDVRAVANFHSQELRVEELVKIQSGESCTRTTQKATYRQRQFLFLALSSYVQSGQSLAFASASIGSQGGHNGIAQFMSEAERTVGEGIPISAVMALYPDIFPSCDVWTVRAGELGGTLPTSFSIAAARNESAAKFEKFFWFVPLAVINFFGSFLLTLLMRYQFLSMWDKAEATGGAPMNPMGELFHWTLLMLPLLIGTIGGYYFGYKWWMKRKNMPRRHHFGYRFPLLGKRALSEAIYTMSVVIGGLFEAGISPERCWFNAINSIPNMAIRDEFLAATGIHTETSTLSQLARRIQRLPPEFALILSTAEQTGSIRDGIGQLASMGDTNKRYAEGAAKALFISLASISVFIQIGFTTIVVAYTWYGELPAKALKGLEDDGN